MAGEKIDSQWMRFRNGKLSAGRKSMVNNGLQRLGCFALGKIGKQSALAISFRFAARFPPSVPILQVVQRAFDFASMVDDQRLGHRVAAAVIPVVGKRIQLDFQLIVFG